MVREGQEEILHPPTEWLAAQALFTQWRMAGWVVMELAALVPVVVIAMEVVEVAVLGVTDQAVVPPLAVAGRVDTLEVVAMVGHLVPPLVAMASVVLEVVAALVRVVSVDQAVGESVSGDKEATVEVGLLITAVAVGRAAIRATATVPAMEAGTAAVVEVLETHTLMGATEATAQSESSGPATFANSLQPAPQTNKDKSCNTHN